jgi:hypothetical protein
LAVIAQLLNRPFLLEAASLVQDEFGRELKKRDGGTRRRDLGGPLGDVGDGELLELLASLKGARDSEAAAEAEEGAEAGRRGAEEEGTPKDDDAFIPRDALLSLLQTTIEEYAEENEEIEIDESPLLIGRRGEGDIPAVTDRRLAEIPLTAKVGPKRRIWGDMEIAKFKLFSDPGWLTSGFAMAVRELRGRAEWKEEPPTIKVSDRARIILVGDWGSGLRRAKSVSDQIKKVLAEDEGVERHVIHLGDVYYSGSKREYERNFFNLWPVTDGKDIGSFALCGNHDMYYGGHAYYGTCLADPLLSRQAGSSHFALESPSWTLIALDTGYEDGGLKGHQAKWARDLIDKTAAGPEGKRIGLLTHHQPFSSHQGPAEKMMDKLEPVLATERIDAWFWGHEHRCIQYGESTPRGHRVGFGSCLGHGGVPEHMVMKEGDPDPPPPWEYEYLKPFREGEPWETFGFAVVDIDGRKMSVHYIDEHGVPHYEVPEVKSPQG